MNSSRTKRSSSRGVFGFAVGLTALLIAAVIAYAIFGRGETTPPIVTEPGELLVVSEHPAEASDFVEVPHQAPDTARPLGEGIVDVRVVDGVGQPVADAVLRLECQAVEGDDGDRLPLLDATTDSAGTGSFGQLPWGRYSVSATVGDEAGRENVTLREERPRILLELILAPSGGIDGIVLDGEGTPLADVTLTMLNVATGPDKITTTQSQEDGTFLFSDLPLGRYQIQSEAAGFAAGLTEILEIGGKAVTIVMGPGGQLAGKIHQLGTSTPVADVSVHIEGNGYVGIDYEVVSDEAGAFQLEHVAPGVLVVTSDDKTYALNPSRNVVSVEMDQAASTTLYVEAAGTVSGRVFEADSGAPIAGAVISISGPDNLGRFWNSQPTDEEGRYQLTSLMPGPLTARLSKMPPPSEFSIASSPTQLIDLQPGEAKADVDFPVDPGQSICGTVVDSAGLPVAMARVVLMKYRPREESAFDRTITITDRDGRFCIYNVAVTMVEVEPDVFEPEFLTLEASFHEQRSEPITFPNYSESLSDVTLKLAPSATGVIAGLVVDDHGVPAHATVSLRHPYMTSGFSARSYHTESDGHFLFQHLDAEDYEIWLAVDNGTGYNGGKKLAHSLTLGPGERKLDLRLVVREGGVITGTVRDADGNPIQGFDVEAWDMDIGDYESSAKTDIEGHFEITSLNGTRYDLHPDGADDQGRYWGVPAKPGDDVDIVLTPDFYERYKAKTMIWIIDPETGEEVTVFEDYVPPVQEVSE